MKTLILRLHDETLAGDRMDWEFHLRRSGRRWSVTGRRVPETGKPVAMTPRTGLTDGAAIHRALRDLVMDAGLDLSEAEMDAAALVMDGLDPLVAAEFRQGEAILRVRDARTESATVHRARRLAPYARLIDAYVLRFSAAPRPRGWPSQRAQARAFMIEHLLRQGRLPSGVHRVPIGGMLDEVHDFGTPPQDPELVVRRRGAGLVSEDAYLAGAAGQD